MYCGIVFTHAHGTRGGCFTFRLREQPERHHVIQQLIRWFDGDLVAAWTCKWSLCCGIPLQLHCTPTAGLVEALVELQASEKAGVRNQVTGCRTSRDEALTYHRSTFGWSLLEGQLAGDAGGPLVHR